VCKECGGSSICEHGRVRSKCKECVRSPRINARDAEAPTEAKVEVKDEPDDVADPGVEVKDEPDDVADPGVEVKDEPEDVADPGVKVKEEPEDVADPGEEDDSPR